MVMVAQRQCRISGASTKRGSVALAGVVLVFSMALWAGCSQKPEPTTYGDISAVQAEKIMSSQEDLVIVDVRERSEYSSVQGHVPGAINYPWSSGFLQQKYQEIDKDKEILLVCRSGARSASAARFLNQKGYRKVYNMLGGTNQWIKEGFKTERSSE